MKAMRTGTARGGNMKIFLVRIGADQSKGGGEWNGPVNLPTEEFAYVPIPEDSEAYQIHPGFEKPYTNIIPTLNRFNLALPEHLYGLNMHLDPDFSYLTYGDQGKKADQFKNTEQGDWIVFYAGLKDIGEGHKLVYALIGLFVVESWEFAVQIPEEDRDINAHTRRKLKQDAQDIVIRAQKEKSGRLKRCIPIGSYYDRAYRVNPEILKEWGGLSVKNGYIHRSARIPNVCDPVGFREWWNRQKPVLIHENN